MIILKSVFAGILLGIPIGPLGALALKRMLVHHPLHGIFFGIGFAMVDAIYTILIGFGMHFFLDFMMRVKTGLFFIGMIFFLILAIHIYLEKVKEDEILEQEEPKSYFESSCLAFVLALFSPATFFAFLSVFGSLGIVCHPDTWLHNAMILIGVVIGGFAWWVGLTVLVSYFRDKLIEKLGKARNQILGGIMFAMTILFATLFFV